MNSNSPRVILVGCGGIARAHVAAIGAAHFVALCDFNLETARGLRGDLNAPIYASLDEALAAVSADVAVICTPPTTHFELVTSALRASLDVLCEKPLATRFEDANFLVELARSRGQKLRTSAKYRFDAGVNAARDLLQNGEAGALQTLRIAFGAPFDFGRSWHANLALSGGGVWMDNGPHALDLARFFAGELKVNGIQRWQCQGDLETEVCLSLRGAGGVEVEIELSWQRALGQWFAVLECERGTLRVGWQTSQWQPARDETRALAGTYDKTAAFTGQWYGFLNDDARLGSDDGARAVELLNAVYQCARAEFFAAPKIF